jgi:TRAP-type C4-dicarboxylate transport system permease small subunit
MAEGDAGEDQRAEVMRGGWAEAAAWLRRRAENIAAGMLAVMFVAFVLQIVFLNFPVGWTSELTVVLWLWLVLWGAAFVVRESEEIRFDLLTASVGRRARIAMGILVALALVVLYGASLKASFDYVTFMKVEKSSYLKIRWTGCSGLPHLRWRSSRATCGSCRTTAAGARGDRSHQSELRP